MLHNNQYRATIEEILASISSIVALYWLLCDIKYLLYNGPALVVV
jgi:hypothetical protein